MGLRPSYKSDGPDSRTDDPALQFLQDCLPLIDQALYGPEADAPKREA